MSEKQYHHTKLYKESSTIRQHMADEIMSNTIIITLSIAIIIGTTVIIFTDFQFIIDVFIVIICSFMGVSFGEDVAKQHIEQELKAIRKYENISAYDFPPEVYAEVREYCANHNFKLTSHEIKIIEGLKELYKISERVPNV